MPLQIEQFMCRTDNFGILLHDTTSGQTALIDAPEEAPILAAIERTGWKPTVILTTHHHGDHVEANLALKDRFRAAHRRTESGGQQDPGHRRGGRGRLGTRFRRPCRPCHRDAWPHRRPCLLPHPGHQHRFHRRHAVCARLRAAVRKAAPVMFESLKKLAALPLQTRIYCGHEYTLANARFALTIDPRNAALKARAEKIEALRADGKPTLPTTLGEELATNPFLRWDDADIRRHLGMEDAPDAEVFAEIRKRKDSF